MAAVHAVELAYRQGAGGCDAGMLETTKHLHRAIIGLALSSYRPRQPRRFGRSAHS
jgi:hypothetical protein